MSDRVHMERIDLMDRMLSMNGEVQRSSNPTIYRRAMSLNSEHSKQYLPRYISLGLYNPDIDLNESACAIIDKAKIQIKLDIASNFKATVKKSWMEICRFIVKEPEDMKRMYDDCPIHDVQAIRNILTLDAVFVTSVLHTLWDMHQSEDHSVLRFPGIAQVVHERGLSKGNTGVLLDILAIFQNQIPFQLIKHAVQMLYDTEPLAPAGRSKSFDRQKYSRSSEAPVTLEIDKLPMNGRHSNRGNECHHSEAAWVLQGMVEVACGLMMYYLPGPPDKPLKSPPLETANYRHLLDCVYRALQHNKEAKFDWPEDKEQSHPIATATQLKRAGIKIVRGAATISDIRFEPGIVEAELILPQVRVTPWTEILLRNLLAYERRVLKKGDLICYLSFMDELIDNEKDVLLMRREIHSFYSNERRKLWIEFYDAHFGRFWVTASVVAAIALLVLTFLQTLYTIKSYYGAGGSVNSNSTKPG
ncbi:hypothetical protein R1flu_025637 [Riccia fluitans]|uniref:Uncharacterized protein n=1 Tax=Riccia fluitans TaxID=41844 RepID=A0ABD1XYP3_9MARC